MHTRTHTRTHPRAQEAHPPPAGQRSDATTKGNLGIVSYRDRLGRMCCLSATVGCTPAPEQADYTEHGERGTEAALHEPPCGEFLGTEGALRRRRFSLWGCMVREMLPEHDAVRLCFRDNLPSHPVDGQLLRIAALRCRKLTANGPHPWMPPQVALCATGKEKPEPRIAATPDFRSPTPWAHFEGGRRLRRSGVLPSCKLVFLSKAGAGSWSQTGAWLAMFTRARPQVADAPMHGDSAKSRTTIACAKQATLSRHVRSPSMEGNMESATYTSTPPKQACEQLRTSGICHTGHNARRAHFNARVPALRHPGSPQISARRQASKR